jgi:hypothetical protein
MNTQFYQAVDLRSKKAMIDFLTNHYRYDTMNSWNRSTSYANKMKVYKCIPSELQSKVFELMEAEGFYDDLNMLIEDWNAEQNYYYQAGFNGRSGGYLVLYEGSVELRAIFTFEGQRNDRDYEDGYGWLSMAEAKKRGLYKKQIKEIGCYPGRSIDQEEDFEEWEIHSLKNRVVLVQSFDKLCDSIVNQVIYMANNTTVKDEEYTIVKKRKVLID